MAAFQRNSKPYNRPTADGQWVHDKAPGSRKSLNGETRRNAPAHLDAPVNSRLLVSGLHYEIMPKDLQDIFGRIGTLIQEPVIRYDRSGRSLGIAVISYETAAEATRAKKQFDGKLAKEQQMTITYDTPTPRRAASAPSSLLNRIQKPALANRISNDEPSNGPGPIRTRGSRKGPKGTASAPSAAKVRPGPKKPKTAEDLDKELDAFMVDSEAVAPEAEAEAAPAAVAQDVEMA
ncbi:hypothetical protein C8J56DRAFT_188700 [Mycena floridula]|nr:hypothetical protein C8J56DRAFT_188700 [Mycena floridula]